MKILCAKKLNNTSKWMDLFGHNKNCWEEEIVKYLHGVGKITATKLEAGGLKKIGNLKAMLGDEGRIKSAAELIEKETGKKLTVAALRKHCQAAAGALPGLPPSPVNHLDADNP